MTQTSTIVSQVTLIACGMFLWDYSATLWFELKFISGELKLRWTLVPYFLTRYIASGFVVGCLLFHTSRRPVNCDALYIGGNLLGKAAIASASANLAVRTAIIWKDHRYITILLVGLVTVQVILIGVGVVERGFFATWSYELEQCIGFSGSQMSDLGFFAPYALCVDFIIVVLTIVGLRKSESTSNLAAALKRQGLTFFFLVLLFQTLVTVAVFAKDADVLVSSISVLCAVISYGILPHGQVYPQRLLQYFRTAYPFAGVFDDGRKGFPRWGPIHLQLRRGEFPDVLIRGDHVPHPPPAINCSRTTSS